MRGIVIAGLLAGLTACGTTPKEVMDSGAKSFHMMRDPPERAALCMARNIENHDAGFLTSIRPLDAMQELIVRLQAAPHAVFVAHITPSGKGSHATLWERGYLLGGADAKAAMLKGCAIPGTREGAMQECNAESAQAAQTSVASAYQADAKRIAQACMERRGYW
jgi:hypothetical protein